MTPDPIMIKTERQTERADVRRRWWIELGLIALFWTVIVVLTAGQHAIDPHEPQGLTPLQALHMGLEYALWLLLTPGIFWLSRRFSLEHGNWLRHLLLHVFVAVTVTVAVDLFAHATYNALVSEEGGWQRPVTLAFSLLSLHFLDELIIYLVVLAAGFARDYFLRYRKHQEEAARLQGEHLRKTHELEEARRLQLSMIPDRVPSLPGLEIAVHMQTATEVGGDYYDFHVADDGALTVAIGDATGHGLKAGMMVAITKGLFQVMADGPDLLQIISKATRTIKEMHLHRLYMAMTLARLKDGRLQVVAAGMPMPLIYRSADQRVEELEVKGMPLGGPEQFPYRQEEVPLQGGDAVLLMSDGFPELFNAHGEMMGYSKAKTLFSKTAKHAPSEVVRQLKREAAAWSGGPIHDDITFVVIKVRSTGPPPGVTATASSAPLDGELVAEPEEVFHP